ncbi:mechanosensitive ion channel family protein [Aestuariimicrobium ganziense]|uniref:mechanosensitive ion channel family protein n=1 Tax=Aestuariimicrobium ganziense TaxID=2773677 RepID=UPI0019417476|nr:mechanosensitive ion channel domain-containing protein [Aestuariimicrobium ganziense]
MPRTITWAGALLALQVFAAGAVAAYLVRLGAERLLLWRGRGRSSARVFSRVAQWTILFIAFSAALTLVFPSVKPVDILGGVTIVSIAAGIAFQTVLGNMFAGLVLLGRDRFRVDDQIAVGDIRGQVTSIGLSSTVVRTFDGRLVVVPNTVLHSEIVTVQTGYEQVRTSVEVGLDETTDLEQARVVAVRAMEALPSVLPEPAPQALLTKVGAATVTLELRFWSGSLQLETLEARNAVISTVLQAFADAGVKTGSDAIVIEPGPLLRAELAEREPQPGDDAA